ncbi:nuclear pore complex protein Nup98-Nup96 isoform X2 [Tribolium madens]|uniref:nuclear pore complex protein Nup98-Nup96 isoform X2 n=1 Tax=Tribolium madens TaxID=41895 RepID=UPI001CF7507B|nr:nuclear pore complex protein Nup98-Nup96 isoform X2 [Tribolium madens]
MYPNFMNKPTFMNNPSSSTFGASTSTFGQPAPNTSMFSSMQPSNIFQSPSTSSFTSGTPSQTSFGTNLFGQQPQPSTSGGLFGSTNAFTQNKTFGFGSAPPQPGLFGQQPQQQAGSSLFQPNSTMLFGSNAFGNQQTTGTVIKFNPVTGTDTMQKNGVTQSISTKHHCITCMKEYENKSLEELRFEDYSVNRKGPQQQAGFGSTPFGASTTTTPSLFGQTDNKPAFGQPQAFGQAPAFGQTTPAFGSTNTTSTPNLFGKPNTFGATTSTPSFGFNPTPATNPFSGNQATKPFSQPLFGTQTTQAPSTFGTGVFGQTNTPNTASNLFQKPAQPTTGFNTGQTGFSFNQPGTTQSSNLFQVSKPNTGFGIFGQTNTGTTGFGQTSQPAFGSNFGKLTPSTFTQPTQPTFGTNLTTGLQQQPLFGAATAKPPSLFGGTTTGSSSLFSNNVFQQTPATYSLNLNQQQPTHFPPESAEENKSISLLATDSFPDGPFVYGLEPKLLDSSKSTTNPQDIKALLDYSKKRDEGAGTGSKIKVDLPRPKRGTNYSKEFFETNQILKSSHKCLVIRKFNDSNSTIYNKYNNELIEEAEESIKSSPPSEAGTCVILSPRSLVTENDYTEDITESDATKSRRGLKLQFDPSITDTTRTSKSSYSFDDSTTYTPKTGLSKTSFGESSSSKSTPRLNGSIGISDDETITETDPEMVLNSSITEMDSTENPAGVILTRPEYYMYPALKDLHQYIDDNGDCIVQGLTIGRRGYGNVHYPDPINIANMNLDEIIHFRHREVIIYPDDTKKPPIGEGLNRRAQVTLDKIYPREKGTNNYITDVNQIIQTNFVDNLMHVTQKHNCKFVDYRPKTGSWVFKVKHFSKYAFTDSDEEECEVPADKAIAKKAQDILKKLDVEEIPALGLGGSTPVSKTRLIQDSESFATEPTILDFWPEDDQYTISEEMYHTESSIQTLKSSLFVNLETPQEPKKTESVVKQQQIPSEVIVTPKVYKLPDIRLAIVPVKVTTTQKCYTELGVFRCNTYKVGWGNGFNFYNYDPFADNEVIYALTHCNIDVMNSNSGMPNLTDLLKVTLEESEFVFDPNQIPTLHIKCDLNYLQKQTDLFNDYVKTRSLSGQEKYICSVWNLCLALWGPGDDTPCMRRQYVSDWLKKFSYELSTDLNLYEQFSSDETEAFKTIFKLLSFHKIAEASEFAGRNNLSQLSLLISQMSANERVKSWLRKYVESFEWKEKDIIADEFKRLYLLLAGIPIQETINTCEGLDWMRSFGVHLWYVAPAAAPINVAFNLYKKAFEELDYAAKPFPPYHNGDTQIPHYDILYQILTLYVDSTHQLCNVLHPETHTDNLMDYRLSWFLLQLFLSLRVGLIRESEKDHLHTTFATQLENLGHWKWAIFSLLFLENNLLKKNMIMRILDRNLSTQTESIERELVKTFKIPPSWIHEVKATKAKLAGRYYEYFQHYIYMGEWQEANAAFVDNILPELFINEQYEYLNSFINKIQPYSNLLVNWNTQVGLVKEFLELQETLGGSSEVSSVGGKLSSLFRRINCFPTKNDKQKLFVVELSRKCALLFKIFHKSLDSQVFQTKFVDILNNLAMPPDIKHYEIFYLINKFTQEEPEIH